MKFSRKSPLFILIALSMTAHASAQYEQVPNQIDREITEGKIAAIEVETNKSVDEKQAQAIKLINVVGTFANDRFSSESDKENAEFAYSGFIARFEGIREDREALERKEILADNKTLASYSQRFDRLITDILKFFK
jgi:hypothetical protein